MTILFKTLPKIKKEKGQLFPGQYKDEVVIFLIRRHWSIILQHISRLILGHIVAVVIFVFLNYFLNWHVPNQGPIYILLVIVATAYFLGIWLFYLYEFVDYHLDIWILTDRRIINIEQEGLFKRTISELDILKIQDVTSELHGKVQTFLDYGNVYIQTASETQRFVFEEVGQPQEVARRIIQVLEKATHNNIHKQADTIHKKFNEQPTPPPSFSQSK